MLQWADASRMRDRVGRARNHASPARIQSVTGFVSPAIQLRELKRLGFSSTCHRTEQAGQSAIEGLGRARLLSSPQLCDGQQVAPGNAHLPRARARRKPSVDGQVLLGQSGKQKTPMKSITWRFTLAEGASVKGRMNPGDSRGCHPFRQVVRRGAVTGILQAVGTLLRANARRTVDASRLRQFPLSNQRLSSKEGLGKNAGTTPGAINGASDASPEMGRHHWQRRNFSSLRRP